MSNIWDRYGWKGRHPFRPWWLIEEVPRSPGVDGGGCDLVRQDTKQLRVSRFHTPLRPEPRTPEQMTAKAEAIDKKYPIPCPAVAVGQVWHFPHNDTDLLVVRRDGESYWMADTETENYGIQLDEWSSSEMPPESEFEKGWLVYGPGAPWAPMGGEE